MSLLTGTVDTISVVGDPLGTYKVGGLSATQEEIRSLFFHAQKKVVIGAGSSAILYTTDLAEATAAHFDWQTIWMVSGALDGQKIPIVGYEGDGDLRVAPRTTDVPAAGDIGILLG